jgi:hypothetical protein
MCFILKLLLKIKKENIMKKYEVLLSRSYIVKIHANNEENARRFSELYLSVCTDLSEPHDQKENRFKIDEVEMTINNAFESKEII